MIDIIFKGLAIFILVCISIDLGNIYSALNRIANKLK